MLTEKLYQLFLAVSVLTMIITPFLMQWSPHLARRAEAVQRVHHWFQGKTAAHLSLAQGQIRLKDHVIIVGYGLNGRNLARVLERRKFPIWRWIWMETSSGASPSMVCPFIMGTERMPTCCDT